MKKFALVVIGLLVVGFLFFGNRGKKDEPDTKAKDNTIENLFSSEKLEMVALLSIKYHLEDNVVVSILDTYRNEHDTFYRLMKFNGKDVPPPNHEYKRTIAQLSERHGVSQETIVNILLDYKGSVSRDSQDMEAMEDLDS